jgi:hypothetical protein
VPALADRRERDAHDPMALRPSSVKDYELLLNKHIIPSLGHIRLAELESSDVEVWYRALGARKTRSREGEGVRPAAIDP